MGNNGLNNRNPQRPTNTGRPQNRNGRPSQSRKAPIRLGSQQRNNAGAAVRRNTVPAVQPQNGGAAALNKKGKKKIINFSIPEKFDFSFFLIVMILLAFGLVMLFSATFASAKWRYGDSYYFVKRQLIFAGVGVAAMIVISYIDYHVFMQKVLLKFAILGSVALMVLVRLFGKTVGGAERWIKIGEITIQPSEILKLVTIIVIADYMQRNYEKIGDFKRGFFPAMLRVAISCALVILQPHLSCTIIIFVVCFCMLCIGGAKASHLWLVVAAVAVLGLLIIKVFPAMGFDYVTTRFLSFNDPEADVMDKTYQTYQSLVTIGSGGIFGQGLGNSRQKYSYLPITENDFIFPVIVEELGFVGAVLVILLFVILLVRGFYIASSAPDKFGMLLCAGIVIQIGLQAFMNIAVATNAMPNTGVSLPFISYGGTALMMQLGEMGIVLNISRKAALE